MAQNKEGDLTGGLDSPLVNITLEVIPAVPPTHIQEEQRPTAVNEQTMRLD